MIPPPSYAATVWLNDQTLCISMESPIPGAHASMVCFPADEYGIKCLLQVLRARESAKQRRTIGHPSEPTQYDLDAIYKHMKESKAPAKPKPKISPNVLNMLRRKSNGL